MIINIYYLLNLSNFINNEITKINDFKKLKNHCYIFKKWVFYLVKIGVHVKISYTFFLFKRFYVRLIL